MRTTKTLAYLLLFVFMGVNSAFAEDTPVKTLLTDYISAINNLGNGTTKDDVLKLFNNRYKSNTAYVRLSGTITRSSSGTEEVATLLDEIMNDNNYSFRLSLGQILYETQKERAGIIAATVDFESTIDGKLAEKGTMLMNLVATVVNGEWKIVHNNMVRISESKDIGNCVCYLYAKGSTKYVTEVYYPAGVEYGQTFEAFRVTSKDGQRVIKSDAHEFVWDKEGNLSYDGRTIGTTDDSREAIEMALRDLYKESCVQILFN